VHGELAELEALAADAGELVEGGLPGTSATSSGCAPPPAMINYP
jgi:hypothetical protein